MAKKNQDSGQSRDQKIEDLERQLSEAKKKKQIEDLETEIASLKSKEAKKSPVIIVKGKAVPAGSRKMSKGAKIGTGIAIAFGVLVSCVALVSESDTEQEEVNEVAASTALPEPAKVPLEDVLVESTVLVSSEQCDLAQAAIAQVVKKSVRRLAESEGKDASPRLASEFAQNNAWVGASSLRDELNQELGKFRAESLLEVTGGRDNASQVDADAYAEVFLEECGLAAEFDSAAESAVQADGRASSIESLAKSVPWYPEGFREFNENVAVKYAGSCDAGFGYCWTYEVTTLTGCPTSLYIEAVIEQNGANVGFANDLTSGVRPLQVARMELVQFEGSGTLSARISEINCF